MGVFIDVARNGNDNGARTTLQLGIMCTFWGTARADTAIVVVDLEEWDLNLDGIGTGQLEVQGPDGAVKVPSLLIHLIDQGKAGKGFMAMMMGSAPLWPLPLLGMGGVEHGHGPPYGLGLSLYAGIGLKTMMMGDTILLVLECHAKGGGGDSGASPSGRGKKKGKGRVRGRGRQGQGGAMGQRKDDGGGTIMLTRVTSP